MNFPPLKRGELIRGRGLVSEGGGLIEDLRYVRDAVRQTIGITELSKNLGKDDRIEELLGTFCDAAQERNIRYLITPTA